MTSDTPGSTPPKAPAPATARTVDFADSLHRFVRRALTRDPARAALPATLYFFNTHLSKEHACLKFDSRGLFVRDCHSTFGTAVNGQVIVPSWWFPLHDGDVVAFIVLKPSGFIQGVLEQCLGARCIDLTRFDNPQTGLAFKVEIEGQTVRFVPVDKPDGGPSRDGDLVHAHEPVFEDDEAREPFAGLDEYDHDTLDDSDASQSELDGDTHSDDERGDDVEDEGDFEGDFEDDFEDDDGFEDEASEIAVSSDVDASDASDASAIEVDVGESHISYLIIDANDESFDFGDSREHSDTEGRKRLRDDADLDVTAPLAKRVHFKEPSKASLAAAVAREALKGSLYVLATIVALGIYGQSISK